MPGGDQGHRGPTDYARDFFTNWTTYEGPLGRKLWLTVRNRARALPVGCCGNHGEPGC